MAIDFETANSDRDSAVCIGYSFGQINGENSQRQEYHLICPPKLSFNLIM